jgi:hypothetical protein
VGAVTEFPAGTTLYHCPLPACGWTHAELPITGEELAASLPEAAFDVAMRRALAVENEAAAHLAGHSLLEWVTEIGRLRGELGAYGKVRVVATDAGRIRASRPDDGTYAAREISFAAGQSRSLAEIAAAFERSNGWRADD